MTWTDSDGVTHVLWPTSAIHATFRCKFFQGRLDGPWIRRSRWSKTNKETVDCMSCLATQGWTA